MSEDPNQNPSTNTSDQNVFKGEQSPNNVDPNTPNTNTQDPVVFNNLVGEGKKYATIEDLAKSRIEADNFIEQLKRENAEMRDELGKRPTLDDIQDIIKLQQTDSNNPPVMDEEALKQIVNSQLEETKAVERAKTNVAQASNKMVELYGEKASEQVRSRASQLGVTVEYMQNLAAQSPDLFYASMGITTNSTSTQSVAGNNLPEGRNTTNFDSQPVGTKEGTWSYYENLRKENPKLYFSPKIQNEIFQKRKENGGDNFYK